jgi:serine/threonine-protein kinase
MSLFECLTGELPYVGPYPEVLVQVSQATRPPSVYGRRPDVGSALATVIERALEKDPTNRFASARELGHALVAATGLAFGATNLLSSPASGTAEDRRSRPRWPRQTNPKSKPSDSSAVSHFVAKACLTPYRPSVASSPAPRTPRPCSSCRLARAPSKREAKRSAKKGC